MGITKSIVEFNLALVQGQARELGLTDIKPGYKYDDLTLYRANGMTQLGAVQYPGGGMHIIGKAATLWEVYVQLTGMHEALESLRLKEA